MTSNQRLSPSPEGGGARGGGGPPNNSATRRRASPRSRNHATDLRRNATVPEKLVWNGLRARQLGSFKFRRQHPIESFVVDFYCAAAKLVVELDGESHEGREAYDRERQRRLESLGFRVFRVTNDEVLSNLDGVLEAILGAARSGGADPSP